MRLAPGHADPARLRRLRGGQVAPHPEEEEHLGARRDRWPLGRGFERFYGFFGGETHQFVPAWCTTTTSSSRRRTYEDGYHLTEDLADRAIEFLDDLRHVDVDKPWLLYLATGACHSPHQAPADWIARYRGHFDAGWDRVARRHARRRQIEAGLLPAHTELSPRPDWVPAWASLPAADRRVYARYMEAFAGFLSHTDAQVGRLIDLARATGASSTARWCWSCPTTGRRRRAARRGRSTTSGPGTSLPTTVEEADARLDEIGGPRIHNNYPVGVDRGRQHPVPALEARDPRGRRRRSARSSHWPGGIGAARRGAPPVRARHRPGADHPRGGRRRAAVDARRRRAAAARGRQLRRHASTTRRRPSVTRRSTTRCSAAGPSTTRAGRRSCTTRSRPTSPASTSPGGSCTTCGPIRRSATTWPPPSPTACGRWSSAGGSRPAATRSCRSTTGRSPTSSSTGRRRSRVAGATSTGPTGRRCPRRGRQRQEPPARHHGYVEADGPGPLEGVLAVQGSVLGGWSFHLLDDGRLCYVHNLAAGSSTASRHPSPSHPGGTGSSSTTGTWPPPQAGRAPGRRRGRRRGRHPDVHLEPLLAHGCGAVLRLVDGTRGGRRRRGARPVHRRPRPGGGGGRR